MCGRFAFFTDMAEIAQELKIEFAEENLSPRYNIAPTQTSSVLVDEGEGLHIARMKWGLIPSWAKDASIGSKMINARAETLAEKPSYRNALKKRRCLVPANGFYEWQLLPSKRKQPLYITLERQKVFTMAGLWESWKNPEGEAIRTFTVITVPAAGIISSFHERMPAVLTGEYRTAWLDGGLQSDDLLEIFSDEHLLPFELTPVSTAVNSPANDYPELLLSVE